MSEISDIPSLSSVHEEHEMDTIITPKYHSTSTSPSGLSGQENPIHGDNTSTADEADLVDTLLEAPITHDTQSLTSTDIRTDPILADLAKKQGQSIGQQTPKARQARKSLFTARAAPASTHQEGLGPRMTKTAALRQGLAWESKPSRVALGVEKESAEGEGRGVAVPVPGYKRKMSLNIASLATPSITPKATRSSQLRAGGEISGGPLSPPPIKTVIKRDIQAVAAENKAKAFAERLERRKSVALPTSLSMPLITPKATKSSMLRAGTMKAVPPVPKVDRALMPSSLENVEKKPLVNRRASVAGTVKSLATPSIAPRMNKAALLRAPTTSSTQIPTRTPKSSSSSISQQPSTSTTDSAPKNLKVSRASIAGSTATTVKSTISEPRQMTPRAVAPPTSPAPRPTKASLLRAGLAAKIKSLA